MTAYTRGHRLTALTSIARVTATILPLPGDMDTTRQASGTVEPGELVEPVAAAGAYGYQATGTPQGRVAKVAGALASGGGFQGLRRYGVAMRPIEHSTLFSDPNDPNTVVDQVNTPMDDGDWVRVGYSGTYLTTLVEAGSSATIAADYLPGTPLTWDGAATRPAGITGTGAWVPATAGDLVLAQVESFKTVGDGGMMEFKLLA